MRGSAKELARDVGGAERKPVPDEETDERYDRGAAENRSRGALRAAYPDLADGLGVDAPLRAQSGAASVGVADRAGIALDPARADDAVVAHEMIHVAQSRLPAEQDHGRGAAEGEAAQLAARYASTGEVAAPSMRIDLGQAAADTDAPPKPVRQVADGEFAVTGDAAKPIVVISADWATARGVKRGFVGRIDGASHPRVLEPIVEKLAELYPWAKDRRDKPLEQLHQYWIGIGAELWSEGEQQAEIDRTLFLNFGLPPQRPVQAFPTDDGVEIYVDTIYSFPSDGDPAGSAAARKQLASTAADELEKLVGAKIDANLRARLEAEISAQVADDSGTVALVRFTSEQLATYVGEGAVEKLATDQAQGGALIQLPVVGALVIIAKDDAERKRVIALLEEIFGKSTAPEEGAEKLTVMPKDIEALFELDTADAATREKVVAMLREMMAAPGSTPDPSAWNAARIRDMIANAHEQVEMREADAKLGRDPQAVKVGGEGILPYPVPGDIINLSGKVHLGMRAEFEFRATGSDDPREWAFGSPHFFHVSEGNVHWYAVRVDDAGNKMGAPEADEVVDYIDSREDGWLNDKRFEHKFEHAGRYEVHAYVVHSKFQPAHFSEIVEVVREEDSLLQMEHLASERWGTETDRKAKVFRGVDDNRSPWLDADDEAAQQEADEDAHDYARGSRAEGRLTPEVADDPRGGAWNEHDRLEREIAQMEAMEAQYSGDDSRSEAMRDHARERRERLETSLERVDKVIHSDDVHAVQLQAHYASRTHGVRSGTLNLVASFWMKDGEYHGELLDNSEVVRSEHFRFQRSAKSYETLMERLFDDLTLTYPDGSISFAFQVYDGVAPTDRFVRFTRKTDTVGKDFNEVAYDDKTRLAVNLLSLILSLFPPTAPLGIGLALVYNGIDVLNELEDAQRTDTMTTAKIVDAGLLALDILPAVGAATKTVRIGGKMYHVIEATQLVGDVYLLAEGIDTGIINLRNGLISQLADKHQRVAELRSTNAASAELAQLEQEIRGLESDIHAAAGKVFTEVVASQGLQMASQAVVRHIAGGLYGRAGDADADADPNGRIDPDVDAAATRGRDVYQLNDVGSLKETSFHNALAKMGPRANARFSHSGGGKGLLRVTTDDGTEHKVDVELVIAPTLDPNRSHDGDAGPGNVDVTAPDTAGGRWKATVTVSSQLAKKADVEHVVGHELDEVVEMVRRYNADPSIDLKGEAEARLFKPGADPSAPPSAHDVAAARELDGLFEAARQAREDYAKALADRNDPNGRGSTVPESIFRRHDAAVARLQRQLTAMGFGDGTDAAPKRSVVRTYARNPDELDGFIDQFLSDPKAQRPDAGASQKLILHATHAKQLDDLGVDPALSQRLLEKHVSGPDMIDVVNQAGQRGLALLDQVVDPRNPTSGIELVKLAAARGQLDAAESAAPSLRRFASEATPANTVLDRLSTMDEAGFDALSWLVGADDRSRRVPLDMADRVLDLAAKDAFGIRSKVLAMIRSGRLANPKSLARFLDTLGDDYGDRYSIDLALEHVGRNDVTLDGGKGDLVVDRAVGNADITYQSKFVNSADSSAAATNAYKAVAQLRGEHGEHPDPGAKRVAVIVLNEQHDLFDKGKADVIDALRFSPPSYDGLKKLQADGTVGWEEIEVRAQKTIIITPSDL
jgi:hypothetical protein